MVNFQKVDSHQHFWQFEPVRDSWITDEMSAIKCDFLPAQFGPVLSQNGIDSCVAVQADQSLAQNDFLLNLATEYEFITGLVGWVDLLDANVEHQLEQYSANKKMKGFRHVLQGEINRALMLEPQFKRGIKHLNKYGYTYDILIFPDQLGYAAELVTAFPNQRFVLDHIGKPAVRTQQLNDWVKPIRELAAHPNVYCKVSGMVTEADWYEWEYQDFVPYLDIVFEAFGEHRLMFGSDWPVCNVAGGYKLAKGILDQYTAQLSTREQALFWGQNAIQFYNL